MKILNGEELAGYMKESQAHVARRLRARKIYPKLVIIRDNDSPVIEKYVRLKRQYGEDIGVGVEDWLREDVVEAIREANEDTSVHGIIVQLPLKDKERTDEVVREIMPEKDVDGLSHGAHNDTGGYLPCEMNSDSSAEAGAGRGSNGLAETRAGRGRAEFESATATAINWLLAGYNVDLEGKKIAIVGKGRLVGAPLERMWRESGYDITVFRSKDSLERLPEYDIIVSATGVPHLITDDLVGEGAVIVDAGTASEDGVLVGDVDEAVRERRDLKAITPKIGGVGPLTVTALFEHVLRTAEEFSR